MISKISSTCFGQTFAHLQESKTEVFFTTYGVVSRKDGYTNSYVVRMWYAVLINFITNWWVCNVMFRYLLVVYSNVYGKIFAYVVVRDFVFLVRGLLCWEMLWLIGRYTLEYNTNKYLNITLHTHQFMITLISTTYHIWTT